MRNPSISKKSEEYYKLPVLTVVKITARTADLEWSHSIKQKPESKETIYYQISLADVENLLYQTVYEGKDKMCSVHELMPLTKYALTLKVGLSKNDIETEIKWAKQFVTVEINTPDETAVTKANYKLLKSVVDNDLETVNELFREFNKQLSVEARDKFGRTLLMIACFVGNPDMVNSLLNHDANPLATTKSGKTALSIAVSCGNVKAAELLLRHNPELIHYIDQGGSTCLMWACENASINKTGPLMIELLIKSGANINAIDNNEQSALDRLCITSGSVRAAHILIKSGIAIRKEPSHKHTMTHLMMAAMNGHKELCREFMEKYECDPRVKNGRGFTAATYAESSDNANIAKIINERISLLNEESEN